MTIQQLVADEHRRVRALHLAAGASAALAASAALLAAGSLLLGDARWMSLPRAIPFVLWAALALANVAVFLVARRTLRTRATEVGVAEAIEREQALRTGALRGAMEVAEQGAFGRAAAQRLVSQLAERERPLAPAHHGRARTGAVRWGAAAAGTVALLAVAAPVAADGLMALLHPVDAWRGTLLAAPAFLELPQVLVRGESLDVRVVARGRRTVVLHHRTTGSGWAERTLHLDDDGVGTARLAPRADLSLVATDGRSASDTAMVQISDRPFVGGVTLRAVYPAYLGRAAELLASDEALRVPQGTLLQLAGRASTSLSLVQLRSGADVVTLRAVGHRFEGALVARRSGRWSWRAEGAAGAVPDVPPPLDVDVVADSAPRVALLAPQSDTVIAADERVTLQLSVTDDHGLAGIAVVSVRQRGSGAREPGLVRAVTSQQGQLWTGTTDVELSAFALQPGDALHVTVTATDNSPWAQQGSSRELVLRVPGTEERRELVRDLADSLAEAARSAVGAQQSLARRAEELSRSRDRGARSEASGSPSSSAASSEAAQAMQHRSAEQARALAQEQRALGEQVAQMRERAGALARQLEQAGALDSSLARQLRDAQQMLREAMTPALLEQMRKLESASQQLQGDAAREALRDLAAMQQRMKEQLEKSAEMLKRAALEGAMQTLGDEATEIARRERALADSAGAQPARSREAANALAERSERLAESLERLQQRLTQERAEPGAQRVAQAQQRAERSEESIRKAAGSQAPSPAQGAQGAQAQAPQQEGMQRNAEAAAQQMEQAAQAMRDAREAQVAEWKQELTAELDRAIQEMLQLAREERALEERARRGASSTEQLRGQQSSVQQGVDRASERLQAAGQKSSLLSGRSQRAAAEAREKVRQVLQQLGQQRAGSAPQRPAESARALGEAADALNQAAASLARDRERANSASSASGFAEMLQQLQEMAKRQGSINGQAQGLMGMPGGPGSESAQAMARALARQQRGIAQQLDEMGDGPGGSRAGELAREARRVADALDGGRLDAATLARQQQLFRRLLDAGRSLEKDERDDQGKREARAAQGSGAHAPGASESGKPGARFREPTWDELRGLSAQDRRAILEYFRRINGPQ